MTYRLLVLSIGLLTFLLYPSLMHAQSPEQKLQEIQREARETLRQQNAKSAAALMTWEKETEEVLSRWLRRGSGFTRRSPTSTASGSRTTLHSPENAVALRSVEEHSLHEPSSEESSEAPAYLTVPESRRLLAAPFRTTLERYAHRRDIPRTLLFAIADVESYWDSTAVSSAGAVGLLQVHPPTGGRWSYSALHGELKNPTREYLKSPRNNINLGTKLLEHLLKERYGVVRETWSRQLLAVAAYNCGGSRVDSGLTDEGTTESTVALANTSTPREIYERLRQTTPDETQEYIQRVFTRRAYYWAWRGDSERVYGVPSPTSQ